MPFGLEVMQCASLCLSPALAALARARASRDCQQRSLSPAALPIQPQKQINFSRDLHKSAMWRRRGPSLSPSRRASDANNVQLVDKIYSLTEFEPTPPRRRKLTEFAPLACKNSSDTRNNRIFGFLCLRFIFASVCRIYEKRAAHVALLCRCSKCAALQRQRARGGDTERNLTN